MTTLETATAAIVDLHHFFTQWFNAGISREQIDSQFLSHLHESFVLIAPSGTIVSTAMLKDSFTNSYGMNTNLQILIHDVKIRQQIGSTLLVTYTEWQFGTDDPDGSNARCASALLNIDSGVTWLHLHETWLPEPERLARVVAIRQALTTNTKREKV